MMFQRKVWERPDVDWRGRTEHGNITGSYRIISCKFARKQRPSLTTVSKNKMVHLGVKMWSVSEPSMTTVTCLLITEDKHWQRIKWKCYRHRAKQYFRIGLSQHAKFKQLKFFFEDYLSQQFEMKDLPFNRQFVSHCKFETQCPWLSYFWLAYCQSL
jgi:hypothetical protein